MNAFEKHGINHLSASSINTFAAEPAMWCLEKLLGKRAPAGAAAHRGISVEKGVEAGLFDPEMPVEECQRIAMEAFSRATALNADPRVQKEREAIAPAVAVALKELRQYGVPAKADSDRQHKISVDIDGVPVPFEGYLDFRFDDHGIVVDLKTQFRLSSAISETHARQGAIYHAALGNYEIRFAYTTPQKIGVYKLENAAGYLAQVVSIAKCMERFLSLSDDKEKLALSIAPNCDSFYWNDSYARALAREVWGV